MNEYYTSFNSRYSSNGLSSESDSNKTHQQLTQISSYAESYQQQFDGFGFGSFHVINQTGDTVTTSSTSLQDQPLVISNKLENLKGSFDDNPTTNQLSYSTSASLSSIESSLSSGTSSFSSSSGKLFLFSSDLDNIIL